MSDLTNFWSNTSPNSSDTTSSIGNCTLASTRIQLQQLPSCQNGTPIHRTSRKVLRLLGPRSKLPYSCFALLQITLLIYPFINYRTRSTTTWLMIGTVPEEFGCKPGRDPRGLQIPGWHSTTASATSERNLPQNQHLLLPSQPSLSTTQQQSPQNNQPPGFQESQPFNQPRP